MTKTIVAVCENKDSLKSLEENAKKLGYSVKAEIQEKGNIINKLSIKDIKEAVAVLFVTSKSVEHIEDIERFIDSEYYEVEPNVVINDGEVVIREISQDLK